MVPGDGQQSVFDDGRRQPALIALEERVRMRAGSSTGRAQLPSGDEAGEEESRGAALREYLRQHRRASWAHSRQPAGRGGRARGWHFDGLSGQSRTQPPVRGGAALQGDSLSGTSTTFIRAPVAGLKLNSVSVPACAGAMLKPTGKA